MNKSYKGIRKYVDEFGQPVFDVIIIKWDKQHQYYNVLTYDNIATCDVTNILPDIAGLWAMSISAAKRKALMDTGFKSSDFDWQEI